MEGRPEFSKHLATIKRGHYGLLDINVKLDIFRELVADVLTTNAIRTRLDECIELQQALAVKRREENKRSKEEQYLKYEMSDKQGCQEDNLPNGKGNVCNSDANGVAVQHEDVPSVGMQKAKVSMKSHMQENGYAYLFLVLKLLTCIY